MSASPMRAALYARVSTADQTCENQLIELRRYVEARGWIGTEFVDKGVSGAKDLRDKLFASGAWLRSRLNSNQCIRGQRCA